MSKLGTKTLTEMDQNLTPKTKIKLALGTFITLLLTAVTATYTLTDKLSAKTEIRTPLSVVVQQLSNEVGGLKQQIGGIKYQLDQHNVQDSLLRSDLQELTEAIRNLRRN